MILLYSEIILKPKWRKFRLQISIWILTSKVWKKNHINNNNLYKIKVIKYHSNRFLRNFKRQFVEDWAFSLMNFQNPNHKIKNWNFTMIRNFSFFEFCFERFRSKKFDSILIQFFRNVFADNVVKSKIVF